MSVKISEIECIFPTYVNDIHYEMVEDSSSASNASTSHRKHLHDYTLNMSSTTANVDSSSGL